MAESKTQQVEYTEQEVDAELIALEQDEDLQALFRMQNKLDKYQVFIKLKEKFMEQNPKK